MLTGKRNASVGDETAQAGLITRSKYKAAGRLAGGFFAGAGEIVV